MKKLFAIITLVSALFLLSPNQAKAAQECKTVTVVCCDGGWTGIVCTPDDWVFFMTHYCLCDEELIDETNGNQ